MRKYYYDYTGQLIEALVLGNNFGGLFDTFERYNYYYYPSGMLKTMSTSYRNNMNNTWETSALDSFIYNGQNALIESYLSYKNPQLQVFQLTYKQRMQYNSLGDITEKVYETWNSYSQSWDVTAKAVFTYRSDNLLSRIVIEEYSLNPNPSLTTLTYNVYYEPINGTSVNDITNTSNKIIVYPNPTNSSFTVKSTDGANMNSVEIYNMLGKQVLKIEQTGQEMTIDVLHLATGNYVLTCIDEKGYKSIQIVSIL